MKKYYWYCAYYIWYAGQKGDYEIGVLEDKHPFERQYEMQKYPASAGGFIHRWELHNWKEITEEEFRLYNKLSIKTDEFLERR